jgi:hypothetical protein
MHKGNDADEVLKYTTTILEKRQYAVLQPIGAQVLRDMEVSMHEPFMESMVDAMLIKMETDIFTENLGEETKVVPFHNFERVRFPSRTPHLAFSAALAAIAVVAFYAGADTWVYLLLILAFLAGAIVDLLITPKEKRVDVSGEVEVEVQSMYRFPENDKVYPKELGLPYKSVEVRTYKRYDDGTDGLDDLEEEH